MIGRTSEKVGGDSSVECTPTTAGTREMLGRRRTRRTRPATPSASVERCDFRVPPVDTLRVFAFPIGRPESPERVNGGVRARQGSLDENTSDVLSIGHAASASHHLAASPRRLKRPAAKEARRKQGKRVTARWRDRRAEHQRGESGEIERCSACCCSSCRSSLPLRPARPSCARRRITILRASSLPLIPLNQV